LHILDPHKIEPQGTWIPSGPIPESIRKFGHVPNISQWLPGDLILLRALKPGYISKQIIGHQKRGGYHDSHAVWHHSAVFLGGEDICHAQASGVRCEPIYRYVGSHYIRVRRDVDLSIEKRYQIALNAATKLRSGYNFGEILYLAFLARKGFWTSDDHLAQPSRNLICSQLYSRAYMSATEKLLHTKSGELTPAFLSSTNHLQDIPVCWQKIGDN
jgi:hypothetical protein